MKTIMALLSAAAVVGCVPHVRPVASKISLEQAMTDVGKGLIAMRAELGCKSFGLYADSVKITFNVTTNEEVVGGLVIDKAPHLGPILGSSQITANDKYNGQIGNVVELTLKNILFTPQDTLAYRAATDHQLYITGGQHESPAGTPLSSSAGTTPSSRRNQVDVSGFENRVGTVSSSTFDRVTATTGGPPPAIIALSGPNCSDNNTAPASSTSSAARSTGTVH